MEYFKTAEKGNDNALGIEYALSAGPLNDIISFAKVKPILPEPGAVNVSTRPLFQWEPIKLLSNNEAYFLQIASDADFENVIYSFRTQQTSHNLSEFLQPLEKYYWKVDLQTDESTTQTDFITSIAIIGSSTINEGTSQQYAASFDGVGNFPEDPVWSVSPDNLASINQSGLLSAFSGSAPQDLIITVASQSQPEITATLDVSVVPVAVGLPTPDNSRLGDERSLELIFEATQGNTLDTLASASELPELPDPVNGARSRRSYLINGIVWSGIKRHGQPTEWVEEGEPWKNKTGWATSGMSLSDDIYGVTTATINGELRVVGLDLINNRLIGELPEWPGLQECEDFQVKQHEWSLGGNQHQRLTGKIPKSLGGISQKIKNLGLSGRRIYPGANYTPRLDHEEWRVSANNIKSGEAANQFTNGLPDELQNLVLDYFELAGQRDAFNGVLQPNFGQNWRIKRIDMSGGAWTYRNNPNEFGNGITGHISSACKNWVDCEHFNFGWNAYTSIALDAFEGWNDIPRYMAFGRSDESNVGGMEQNFPDMSHMSQVGRIQADNQGWTGPYPRYFHEFTDGPSQIGLTGSNFDIQQDFPTFKNLGGTTFGFEGANINNRGMGGGQYKLFSDADLGGCFNNRLKILSTRFLSFIGSVPTGMHEWYQLRHWFGAHNMLGPDLPARPPGEYSPSLAKFFIFDNKFNCRVPEWGETMGSKIPYGAIFASGGPGGITHITVDESDPDNDEWIYDIRINGANFTPNEFVPDSPTATRRRIHLIAQDPNDPTKTVRQSRGIISNTTDTIRYKAGQLSSIIYRFNLAGVGVDGNTRWEITPHGNDDVRPFNGLSYSRNDMYGLVTEKCAPVNMVQGAWSISTNLLTYKDIRPTLAFIENMATNNGWEYKYWSDDSRFPHQKPFGAGIPGLTPVTNQTVAPGGTLTIDFSDYVNDQFNNYTWYRNGQEITNADANISGADTNILTQSNVQIDDNGNVYMLKVTNSEVPKLPFIDSNEITLTVS